MPEVLSNLINLALVVFGFGSIVFFHELGHFLAAKWAGIRVLAFAVGFGSPIFTWRKGVGFRRGSSEPEYRERLQAGTAGDMSPTEYRLNWLPLGGYVKMLGQEDMDPTARSGEPDSYQNCPVPKRLVVISAGVVMNLIGAVILFVGVFMSGLMVSPPIIGAAVPGGAASQAVALNASEIGAADAALLPGDTILSINGRPANRFDDLLNATGLAGPNEMIELEVQRGGLERPLLFSIKPQRGRVSNLLELGIEPPRSAVMGDASAMSDEQLERARGNLASQGFGGLEVGARLVSIDGSPVRFANELSLAAERSEGRDMAFTFENPGGDRVELVRTPTAEMSVGFLPGADDVVAPIEHLLGFTPVMMVVDAGDAAAKGLVSGDVFLRLGSVEYPGFVQGLREIRASGGRTLKATVLRDGAEVELDLAVERNGTIGFSAGATSDTVGPLAGMLSLPPRDMRSTTTGGEDDRIDLLAQRIVNQPGLVLSALLTGGESTPIASLRDLGPLLRSASGTDLALEFRLPGSDQTLVQQIELTEDDRAALATVGWASPVPVQFFGAYESKLRADGPLDAAAMGVAETRSWMIRTYLTLGRLFQGTVRIEHLRGPVGIAHLGTVVADRGLIWLMFFMGLISVNLAVINFLPLPIVDGGQFLLLVYEWIRGKPVPVRFQEVITLAGLALIGTVFLIVTFQDLSRLIGG